CYCGRAGGAGPAHREEIDARAYVLGNGKTETLARYLPQERPLAMQLLGADPELLAEAARRLEATGADGIDLNMGCPVPKIVAKGQGAALMRDPLAAAVIFRTLRKTVIRVPFTIKIRGGWDDHTIHAVEIGGLAGSEGGGGSVEDARAMVAATGCASVMIGRGALGAPWIFRGAPLDRDGRAAIIRRHAALIETHLPDRLAVAQP